MKNRVFVKDVLSVFITKAFVLVLSLMSVVLLARGLGVEGRGLLAAILIYPQLLIAIAEGGMRQSAVYYMGRRLAPDAEILAALLAYVLVAGFLGYVFTVCLIIFAGVGAEGAELALIYLAALVVPSAVLVNAFKGYFLGKEKIKDFNATSWVEKVVYVSLLMLLFFLGKLTIFSALLVLVCASLINVARSWYYANKFDELAVSFNFLVAKGMIKKGALYALALFFITANYKLNILLLGYMSNVTEVGYYAVSLQISELMWQLPAAMMVILLSRSANRNPADFSWPLKVAAATRTLLFISFFVFLFLALSAYLFVEYIFGQEYGPAKWVVVVLLLSAFFMVPFKSLNADFAGSGKPMFSIYVTLPSIVVNVILCLCLVPPYGALGAAISVLISYAVCGALIVLVYSKVNSIPFKDLLIVKYEDIVNMIAYVKKMRR